MNEQPTLSELRKNACLSDNGIDDLYDRLIAIAKRHARLLFETEFGHKMAQIRSRQIGPTDVAAKNVQEFFAKDSRLINSSNAAHIRNRLFKAIRNDFLDALRAKTLVVCFDETIDIPAPSEVEVSELVFRLEAAEESLKNKYPEWYDVYIKRVLGGEKYSTISKKLGIGTSTAQRRYQLALAHLEQNGVSPSYLNRI